MRTGLRKCARGAAIVELALAAPLLLAILSGIVAYGGWFWMSHTLQQAANDAARASIAGLTSAERQTLAAGAVDTDLRRGSTLDPTRAAVTVSEDSEMVTISVRYDASNSPFLGLSFVPMPATVIRRTAAIRLAGL